VITEPVRPGTAEQLARCWYLRGSQMADAAEIVDDLASFLMGPVGGHGAAHDLWWSLDGDLRLLWNLMDGGWQPDDLDELSEDDWARHHFPSAEAELLVRYERTRTRVAAGVESAVRIARYRAAEESRAARLDGAA
jgi:hypothetical protein